MHPLIVRHVVMPLHERLKRTPTFAWLERLDRSQWMDPATLRELQFAELRRHLELAYRHTRYYRRLFDEHEVPPQRIQSLDDFRKVPVLTRQLLRENFADLASTGLRLGRVQRVATGGSTGEPTPYLHDPGMLRAATAARLYSRLRMGWKPGMPTMSASIACVMVRMRTSVYRMAAGGSPSTEPKLPWPSMSG